MADPWTEGPLAPGNRRHCGSREPGAFVGSNPALPARNRTGPLGTHPAHISVRKLRGATDTRHTLCLRVPLTDYLSRNGRKIPRVGFRGVVQIDAIFVFTTTTSITVIIIFFVFNGNNNDNNDNNDNNVMNRMMTTTTTTAVATTAAAAAAAGGQAGKGSFLSRSRITVMVGGSWKNKSRSRA